jgi:hypothetical protein
MTRSLNTTSAVPVKNGGNGHTPSKSIAACNAADAVDAISRALARVLGVCPQYVGNARKLTLEQREAVRRGDRPVIFTRSRKRRPRPVEVSRREVEKLLATIPFEWEATEN